MDAFARDPPIERRLADRLRERGETVAVAETCTGGLVGTLLTAVPGASDYLDRVFVPYDYDALRTMLAVPRETLDEHGAVSEPTAATLARRARDAADATWGVSTVGVAGPGGGTTDTPVGTGIVGVAHAAPWGTEASRTDTDRETFDGDRAAVREHVARAALWALHDALDADGS